MSVFDIKKVDADIIRALASSCSNLTELVIHNLGYPINIENIDSELSQVFNNNKKINTLYLSNFKELTGECFLSLDKNTIEVIVLYGICNINPLPAELPETM